MVGYVERRVVDDRVLLLGLDQHYREAPIPGLARYFRLMRALEAHDFWAREMWTTARYRGAPH